MAGNIAPMSGWGKGQNKTAPAGAPAVNAGPISYAGGTKTPTSRKVAGLKGTNFMKLAGKLGAQRMQTIKPPKGLGRNG